MKSFCLKPLVIGTTIALSACAALPDNANKLAAPARHSVDFASMDTGVKPCENFFQYANGTWIKNNPIPPDRSSWGAFNELRDRNLTALNQVALAAALNPSPDVNSKLVGDFYMSAMDTAKIEAAGAAPLQADFARIDAMKNSADLIESIASKHARGVNAGFNFFVAQDATDSTQTIAVLGQGGLGLPDRDYYLKDDQKSKELRASYLSHVKKMFVLLGDAPDAAEKNAQAVMALETRLAQASNTKVEMRDPKANYNPRTLTQLAGDAPGADWPRYFNSIGLAQPGSFNVAQPKFFKALAKEINSTAMADWKTYLRWHTIKENAPMMSKAFADENFEFFNKTLNGQKEQLPRWKRMVQVTDNALPEALGKLYVEKNFAGPAKQRTLDLVKNLRIAMRERIQALEWMDQPTRMMALKKLDAFAVKIGYPDKWRDYSALKLSRDSLVQNMAAANEFEFKRQLAKVGKPVDRNEWGMSPPTVNAYYNPEMNEIVFPAGILQPPFFDADGADAANYGAIGMVIGHELTHGFDDEGRQYDAQGNLKTWWTDTAEKNFNERAALVEAQYNQYKPLPDMAINGKLTLGENIADLGGIKMAYLAWQKSQQGKPAAATVNGLTPEQQFFVAYGQVWRGHTRPEQTRLRLTTDPHSPPEYRIRGSLENMPEFLRAFNCPAPAGAADGKLKAIW
ncbi:MAG: M13 family metallopeptidase [Burkholderiales bacterium]